jgi:peptidoglycan hydrolase-like protein with peptidoglycan-binding domain
VVEDKDKPKPGNPVPSMKRVDTGQSQAVELARLVTENESLKNAKDRLEGTLKSLTIIKNPLTVVEKNVSFSEGKRIQESLCVKADGNFGGDKSETRQAIKLYQAARDLPENERDGKLHKTADKTALIDDDKCIGGNEKYLNAYEKFRFKDQQRIKVLQDRINNELTTLGLTPLLPKPFTGKFDEETRNAIKQLKQKKQLKERPEQLTPDLDADLDT